MPAKYFVAWMIPIILNLILFQQGFAQELAETRRWIGFGNSYGDYGEKDLDGTYSVKGLANEIMMAHKIFDDGTAFGQALLDTRFEKSFEDKDGNYHHVNTRVFHSYFSYGYGRSYEMTNKLHLGGTVDLIGGLGLIVFKKDYILASGQNLKFSEKFGFDILTGYQMSIFMDLNNYWVIGWKTAYYQNRLYLEFGDTVGNLNHMHSNMMFIGTKLGFTDCVPTAYVQC